MTSPHDRPTAAELIESVREWLERDVAASGDGHLAFHTRVAMNSLDIVLRELAAGDSMSRTHVKILESLGVASDEELSLKIRSGDFDSTLKLVLDTVAPVIEDKVRVSNPKYLL